MSYLTANEIITVRTKKRKFTCPACHNNARFKRGKYKAFCPSCGLEWCRHEGRPGLAYAQITESYIERRKEKEEEEAMADSEMGDVMYWDGKDY
jgi:ribosomal protein L37AE/L43A